jgi:hypothetical protein
MDRVEQNSLCEQGRMQRLKSSWGKDLAQGIERISNPAMLDQKRLEEFDRQEVMRGRRSESKLISESTLANVLRSRKTSRSSPLAEEVIFDRTEAQRDSDVFWGRNSHRDRRDRGGLRNRAIDSLFLEV